VGRSGTDSPVGLSQSEASVDTLMPPLYPSNR
jgi:hypothetical protein